MREKNYPSDVSRERFEQIRPILEQARKRTKPVTVDMYEGVVRSCCICYGQVARGVRCPVTFRSGARCIPTLPSGAKWTMKE